MEKEKLKKQQVRIYLGSYDSSFNATMKQDDFLTEIAREIVIWDAPSPPFHNYWYFYNIPAVYFWKKHRPHLYVIGETPLLLFKKLYIIANGIIFDDDKDYDDELALSNKIGASSISTEKLLQEIEAHNIPYYINLLQIYEGPSHNSRMENRRGWFSYVGIYYYIPPWYIISACFFDGKEKKCYEFRHDPANLHIPFLLLTTPFFSVIWVGSAVYEALLILAGWWEYNHISKAVSHYINTNAKQV